MSLSFFYPVRNNGLLLYAGLDFRIFPAGFNAPLKFLTGFTFLDGGKENLFNKKWEVRSNKREVRNGKWEVRSRRWEIGRRK
jgi:hypothetical protein